MKVSTGKIVLLFIGIYFSTSAFGQLPHDKLKITHLTGDYFVFTTYSSYKGQQVSANGMYLVTDSGVVMFDTPWDTTQFQPLLDSIKARHNQNVILCIATHSHEDRTAGLEFLRQKGVKTYTTKRTDDISKVRNQKRAEFLIYEDTIFSISHFTFQTFYGGQGHTSDNIVLWFDKDKILYGGCLVKSTEAVDLGYTAEANLKEWIKTIKNVKKKFGKPKYIITGHQDWTDTKSLDHTLELLRSSKESF